LVTLAFAEVFRILANATPSPAAPPARWCKLRSASARCSSTSPRRLLLSRARLRRRGAGQLNRVLERSRFGAWLVAVRENEDAARALGVDTLKVKLKAITLSAAITAVAGALYTQKFLYVDANIAYGAWISVEALLAPIVGGIGTCSARSSAPGADRPRRSRQDASTRLRLAVPGIDLVVYGALLIVIIAFAPRGLIGLLMKLRARLGGRMTAGGDVDPAVTKRRAASAASSPSTTPRLTVPEGASPGSSARTARARRRCSR
jgi:branched-chain amino acid transport system permease protein